MLCTDECNMRRFGNFGIVLLCFDCLVRRNDLSSPLIFLVACIILPTTTDRICPTAAATAAVGVDICFIDNACYERGDAYSYRESRSNTYVSECQVCEPSSNDVWWSVKPGYDLVYNSTTAVLFEPPNDCRNTTVSPTLSPPTNRPTPLTKEPSIEDIVEPSSAAAASRFSWRAITGILTGFIAAVWLI
jgi:hypothetical protein